MLVLSTHTLTALNEMMCQVNTQVNSHTHVLNEMMCQVNAQVNSHTHCLEWDDVPGEHTGELCAWSEELCNIVGKYNS